MKIPSWKQHFLEIRAEHFRKKTPVAVADHGVPSPPIGKYRDDTGNGLNNCVRDFLEWKGHYTNRIQSQGQIRVEKVKLAFGNVREIPHWTKGTTNEGTLDIDAIINGRTVKIETKGKGDKLRPAQIEEIKKVEAAGGITFVAYNMPSFLNWYYKTFHNTETNF